MGNCAGVVAAQGCSASGPNGAVKEQCCATCGGTVEPTTQPTAMPTPQPTPQPTAVPTVTCVDDPNGLLAANGLNCPAVVAAQGCSASGPNGAVKDQCCASCGGTVEPSAQPTPTPTSVVITSQPTSLSTVTGAQLVNTVADIDAAYTM